VAGLRAVCWVKHLWSAERHPVLTSASNSNIQDSPPRTKTQDFSGQRRPCLVPSGTPLGAPHLPTPRRKELPAEKNQLVPYSPRGCGHDQNKHPVRPKSDSDSGDKYHHRRIHRIPHQTVNPLCHKCQGRLPRLDVSRGLTKVTNRKTCQDDPCCNQDSARTNRIEKPKSPRNMKGGRNQSSARPSSNAASAMRGGGAITPGLSTQLSMGSPD
jgi:hypothetical protein